MIAILGSGFGLYGYLPALVQGCGQRVVLAEQYRVRYEERPELARFAHAIQWEADDSKALAQADGVVIALRPADQVCWIRDCLQRGNLKCLLLEKPLASSPADALSLCRDLSQSDKIIRMGYTFRYTDWGQELLQGSRKATGNDSLSIEWNFLAHHLRRDLYNWKRSTASGGGALRFYGIQVIALLAELGYSDVLCSRSYGLSQDEIEKWTASLMGTGLPACSVAVESRATSDSFSVEMSGAVLVAQTDPFSSSVTSELDRRVPALTRLCQTLREPNLNETGFYTKTVELWQRIEDKTLFEIRPTLTTAH